MMTNKRKMSKAEAGRLGGLSTLRKHGIQHYKEIGKKGASVTWARYALIPFGTSKWWMVDRETLEIVATF